MEIWLKVEEVFFAGGKWLMLKVADEKVLDDVIGLIKLRVNPKNK